MNKHELIELTKELLSLEDLSSRGEDLLFLKREYKYFSNKDEESYYESQLTAEFISLFEELAKREPKLTQSSYDEKKEIIALAKKLLEREDILKASKELDEYSLSFKKAGRCNKEQDDELWGEFRAIKEEIISKKKAYFEALDKSNEEKQNKKKDIISRAKSLLDNIKNLKEANEKMDALMEEWKQVGFSGKNNDQALWEEFSEVRKQFQTKKKEHLAEMVKLFEERAEKKEEMIKAAKKLLADSDFSNEEVKKVKEMQIEFNKIGFAGKEKDEELYQQFSEVIKKYFEDKKFYTF